MERKNLKCKNLRPSIGQKHLRLWDAKISWKQDFWDPSKMLPRFWHWAKIFWDPHFSRYCSIPLKCKVQLTSDTLYQFIYTIKWLILKGFLLCLFHQPTLENCRVVTFVHHIVSQSFFFTLKRNKRYCIHHLTLIWVWVNLYCINFIYFTHYTGPQLKVVSTMSVGFDHVSLPEAVKR